MTLDTKDVTLAVLGSKIDGLDAKIDDLLSSLRDHDARIRVLEKSDALQDGRVTAAHQRLDVQFVEIEEVKKLVPVMRMVMWVGAMFGVSIVALIWSLITGGVHLVP